MKLVYVSHAPIACDDIALLGGRPGNNIDLDAKLSIMYGPERIDEALEEARTSIVAEIRKAEKQGRVVIGLQYECEIVDSVDAGGVLVEGAYLQLTAQVEYDSAVIVSVTTVVTHFV